MANFKDRAKARSKQLALGDKFKLHQEDNYLRILPTPESKAGADDEVFAEILMHSGVGPDPKSARFLRCGHDVYDKAKGECYICDVYIPKLIARGHNDTAKELKAKWNLCLQVLTLDEDTQKYSGPFFYQVGGKLGRTILTTLSTGKRDITHPEKGYTFCINRQGEQLSTTYSGPFLDEDPSEIPQKYVDMLKPFAKLAEMPQYSEQDQKSAIKGEKGGGAPDSRSRRGVLDDDDEDERPRKRRAVAEDEDEDERPRKRRSEPDEDEDVEETPKAKAKKPVVDEDEDEDERPVRKPPAKRAAVVEDEDEDEVDEDEETTPPARKSKTVAVTKKSRAVEPEDEDEDEETRPVAKKKRVVEPEDDEDEDEPAPPPKKKRAAVVDEDEDEPAPKAKKKRAPVVEDEDEDEKPAPKSKAKKKPVDDEDPFADD